MKICPTCKRSYPSNAQFCTADGVRLEEAGLLAEGTIVRGKYRILEKVGEGGMGQVYKAVHIGFDEPRALKIMSEELMKEPTLVERFKHEAFIARKLQHPNVVRVDDIDEAEDGRPFIVMEFIEGQSLRQAIESQNHLSVPRACRIAKQVADALDAAHRLGMIHRDIKPDNVALIGKPFEGVVGEPQTTNGELAKVLDFGIARLREARGGKLSSITLTGTGMVIGTAQYMSPEQAAGKRGDELDGRSDIYSLGVVMYQMLTGALPFQANTAVDMVLSHMQLLPPPIASVRSDISIPDPIAALVMKCLEKDRANRPTTAGEVVERINQWEKSACAGVPRRTGALPASKTPEPSPREAVGRRTGHPTPHTEVDAPTIKISAPPALRRSRAASSPATGSARDAAASEISSFKFGISKHLPLSAGAVAILILAGGIVTWKMTSHAPSTRSVVAPTRRELDLQSQIEPLLKGHQLDAAITKWQEIEALDGTLANRAREEVTRLQNLEQSEKELFAKGQAAQAARNYDEAKADYSQVVRLDGRLRDQAEQAIKVVELLMAAGSNVDLTKIEQDELREGQRTFAQKHYGEARRDFQQVIALNLPGSTLRQQAQDRLQEIDRAIARDAEIEAAKKAREQALAARKQALDASLQQFNGLKSQRKYDDARALLNTIGPLGGDTEGLSADLASAASAEFRELQAKRRGANQRRDIPGLQNLVKGYQDLARRDSSDSEWSRRARDVAENQIPEEIRALTPRAPGESPTRSQTGPAKARPGKQAEIRLMAVGHTGLTGPFDAGRLYQQNLLDPGFRLEREPDLSSVNAPKGATLDMTLVISAEGSVEKLYRCMSGGPPACQAAASASGWKFSSPQVNHHPARAIVGVVVKF